MEDSVVVLSEHNTAAAAFTAVRPAVVIIEKYILIFLCSSFCNAAAWQLWAARKARTPLDFFETGMRNCEQYKHFCGTSG